MSLHTRPRFIIAMALSAAAVGSALYYLIDAPIPTQQIYTDSSLLPVQDDITDDLSLQIAQPKNAQPSVERALYAQFIAHYALPDDALRAAAMRRLFSGAIHHDPGALRLFLNTLNIRHQRHVAYLSALPLWVETDVTSFLAAEPHITFSQDHDEAFLAMSEKHNARLLDRLRWAAKIQQPTQRISALERLIVDNADTQGETLINWALSDQLHQLYLPNIYSAISHHNPVLALTLYNALINQPASLQESVLEKMALTLPTAGIDEAVLYAIEGIHNEAMRDLMINMALPRLIDSGYIEALDELLRRVYPDQEFVIQQTRLASNWARRDAQSAISYSERIHDRQQRQLAYAKVIEVWAAQDAHSAEHWLAEHSEQDGVQHSAARFATIASGSEQHLPLALHWLTMIDEPDIAANTLEHVLTNWAQYDYAAANDYLQDLPTLADAQKQKIQHRLDNIAQ